MINTKYQDVWLEINGPDPFTTCNKYLPYLALTDDVLWEIFNKYHKAVGREANGAFYLQWFEKVVEKHGYKNTERVADGFILTGVITEKSKWSIDQIPEDILKTHISNLEMTIRTCNALLADERLKTVEDILSLSITEIHAIPTVGIKSLVELKTALIAICPATKGFFEVPLKASFLI